MTITNVRLILRDEDKLKAFATITIDNCFVVRGLKVIAGRDGTFVAMPARRIEHGYQDIAHPINEETRKTVEDAVLTEYRSKTGETE